MILTFSAVQPFLGQFMRAVDRGFVYPVDTAYPEYHLCSVCSTVISTSFELCSPCSIHQKKFGKSLANIVVPLSYVVKGSKPHEQFYNNLHSYKGNPSSRAAIAQLSTFVTLFKQNHFKCLEKYIGEPISTVIVVPSTRGRVSDSLTELANIFGARSTKSFFTAPKRIERINEIRPNEFGFEHGLKGHVLVLEDTWVSGANAQSVAVAARKAGAEFASIVTIARYLVKDNNPMVNALVSTWDPKDAYNVQICPVDPATCLLRSLNV